MKKNKNSFTEKGHELHRTHIHALGEIKTHFYKTINSIENYNQIEVATRTSFNGKRKHFLYEEIMKKAKEVCKEKGIEIPNHDY